MTKPLSLPLFHVSGQGSSGAGCWPARDSRYVTKQPLAQMLHGCTHASLVPTSYGAC